MNELSGRNSGWMARTFPEGLPDISGVAAALADSSRAAMCAALMDGRAWTATELAEYSGLGRPTVSKHLDRLVQARIVTEVRQGRHRYLRLAGDDVAALIETLGAFSQRRLVAPSSLRSTRRNSDIRAGRTCYKHLAGRLGVGLTCQMRRRDILNKNWSITQDGMQLLTSWGLQQPEAKHATPCMDSTERRYHLAGPLGVELCATLFRNGWVQRIGTIRAVRLTPPGQQALASADLAPLTDVTTGAGH